MDQGTCHYRHYRAWAAMIIRLNTDHIEDVLAMLSYLHDESKEFSAHPEDADWVTNSLIRMLNDPKHIMLGVTDPYGSLIAVMFGAVAPQWYSPRLEAYEMLLAVVPAYRGSPVAYRLIKEFERESASLGACNITVGTSLGIADERAVALYNRLGYSHCGTGLSKRIKPIV
jgi:GNAT superfamily N-acetyltransferase